MTKNVTIDGLITAINDIVDELILIENKPTVEINKEGVTPSENAETITLDTDTFAVNGVEINKTGVIPSETLTTLTQGNNTYSVGGEKIFDIIMGDLDNEYGTTPANYIGTFNQWDSIDTGKSFADYDEILLVCRRQSTEITDADAIQTYSVNVEVLKYYDTMSINYYSEGSSLYCKYGLDYTNNKFYLANFNYLCPIALVGIKYN